MTERVDLLLPYGFSNVSISTFHAFGDKILREFALDPGLNPDFQVLSQPEQVIFFRDHIFEFPLKHYRLLSDPTRFIMAMLNVISRAKDEDISPEQYCAYVQELRQKVKDNPEDDVLNETYEKQKRLYGHTRISVLPVLCLYRDMSECNKELNCDSGYYTRSMSVLH